MSTSQTVSYSKRANFKFQDSPFTQKEVPGKYRTADMSRKIATAEKSSKADFTSPSILSVSNLLSPIPPAPTEQSPSQYANQSSKLDLEPNPFEQSFGTAATEGTSANDSGATSPKSILPPISSIDSPQPLNNSYAWGAHSLRSGPLSPSMLVRPQNQNGLSRPTAFSPFGTQPSPMTAALLGAAGQVTTNFLNNLPNNSLQLKASDVNPSLNLKRIGQTTTQTKSDLSSNAPTSTQPMPAFQQIQHPRNSTTQVNISTAGQADFKGHDKIASIKAPKTLSSKSRNGKTKSPSPSRRRKSTVSLVSNEGNGGSDDEDSDENSKHKKNKIEDPEEKRKNFLERNRQAALKCRQRKKQWLNNLQGQVEYFTQENEQLQNQATALREEIINLKTLLIAHKDCPVAQSNGVGLDLGSLSHTIAGSAGNPARINPVMGMPLIQNTMNPPPMGQTLNGVAPGISSMHSSQMHPNTSNPNMMRY